MATEDNIVISFSAPYRYFGFEMAYSRRRIAAISSTPSTTPVARQ